MEAFTALSSNLPATIGKLGSYLMVSVGLVAFFSFIYSLGAAKLSYAYNTSVGSSSAFLWAIIAFFFSGFYYPYYAFFVDPVGSTAISSVLPPVIGGRRRK
jgi:amino acid transporter